MAGEGPSLLDGIDSTLLEELKKTKVAAQRTSVFVDARYTEQLLQNTLIQEKMQQHSMRRQETPVQAAPVAAPAPPPKRKIPSPVVAEMYSTDEDEEDTERRYSGVTRNINIVIPRKQSREQPAKVVEGLSPLRQKLLMKGLTNWEKNKDLHPLNFEEIKSPMN